MKNQTFDAMIPFSGFYNAHESEADREIESLANYYASETPDDLPQWLADLAFDSADFEAFRDEYAKEYVTSFLQWLGFDGEFSGMESPRFYNFETDRVFAKLTRDDIARAWHMADKDVLTRICNERLTSRSGFVSHYSPDWKTWGALSSWDHNQLGMLMIACADTEQGYSFDYWSEVELMENAMCNGIGQEIWTGEKSDRFWKLFNYMMDRAKRPIRTLEQWHAARRAENKPFGATPLGAWCAM